MIWNTRAYQQLLFGFCWYREELRLPNCAIPVVIEHEFKDGYTWIKRLSKEHFVGSHDFCTQSQWHFLSQQGTSTQKGNHVHFSSTWNSNDPLGFFVLNRDIQISHHLAKYNLVIRNGGEKWFQRLWSGFYGCQLNQIEIQDEWMQQYFNCKIQPRIEATGCRSFRVKHGFRFSGISTWMECDIWQGKVSPFRVIGLKLRDPLIMGISLRRRR